jgi:hypothetical protein
MAFFYGLVQRHPNTEGEDGIYGDYIREVDPVGKTVWEWWAMTGSNCRHPRCKIENNVNVVLENNLILQALLP